MKPDPEEAAEFVALPEPGRAGGRGDPVRAKAEDLRHPTGGALLD